MDQPAMTEFTGQEEPESHGLGWLQFVLPDDRDVARDAWTQASQRGGVDVEYRIRNASDGEYRWFRTRAVPVRDDNDTIVEWVGTSTDVDDMRSLQKRQELLVSELQHRVRNMLTVVRSVFSRTFESSGDEDLADHFKGRLDSLARTQVIVTRSAAGRVDLENLIRDELLSVGEGDRPNLSIGGPDVTLGSKAAESIGLAIHELTTNAVKYGALQVPTAKLDISWQTNIEEGGQQHLILVWQEQGVPTVPIAPSRDGFGRELIEQALPYRLGAKTKLEFLGGGVRCTISVPLTAADSS